MSDLRRMLDANYEGHKSEINDYRKGHLNFNKMKQNRKVEWRQQSVPASNHRVDHKLTERLAKLDFDKNETQSLNTTPRVTHILTKDAQVTPNDLGTEALRNYKRGALSYREELSLQASRIYVEEYPAHSLRKSLDGFESVHPQAMGFPFIDAFSHKDRFQQMKRFKDSVVREQDVLETKMLTGNKKVAPLEQELKQKLAQLEHDGHIGPNFHRLQVYSESLNSVIKTSPLFGQLLHEIKREYDSYLHHLLNQGTPQHPFLQEQVQKLLDKGITSKTAVADAQKDLDKLENEVRHLLENRARLKKSCLEAKSQRQKEMEERQREKKRKALILKNLQLHPLTTTELAQKQLKATSKQSTHAEEIDSINAVCWRYIDELEELRQHLRENCTPIMVIQQLQEHIYDKEVQYRQLENREEELKKEISAMEKQLNPLLPTLSGSEKEKDLVKRLLDVKDCDLDRELFGQGPVTEQEDEYKWNWYIW